MTCKGTTSRESLPGPPRANGPAHCLPGSPATAHCTFMRACFLLDSPRRRTGRKRKKKHRRRGAGATSTNPKNARRQGEMTTAGKHRATARKETTAAGREQKGAGQKKADASWHGNGYKPDACSGMKQAWAHQDSNGTPARPDGGYAEVEMTVIRQDCTKRWKTRVKQ